MNMIFSADQHWGIGCKNRLLFRVKADLAYFKRMTTGKTVVMGRSTLLSLPGARPLPDRENVVLSTNPAFAVDGAVVCSSLTELFAFLRGKPSGDIFVIGGKSVYLALLEYCENAYITRFNAAAWADCTMPDFDTLPNWRLTHAGEWLREDAIGYRFLTYHNENPKAF